MKNEDLRKIVIGCAFKVHNTLGAGFLEKVYENAMRIEIESNGIQVEVQSPINVLYFGQVVGEFLADLLVENELIIELKAVRQIITEHEVQLVNYLTATGIDDGLLINFGSSVTVKRNIRLYHELNPVYPVNPV